MITIDDIKQVNPSFFDVYYSTDEFEDRISIHISNGSLDTEGILSTRFGGDIYNEPNLFYNIKEAMAERGYSWTT